MTVQELMDVMSFCDLLEVTVRKTGRGQWIQGYRIGKDAKIFPSEQSKEMREERGLKFYENKTLYLEDGAEVDVKKGINLPMKIICKDCHKLPEYIGNLEVCDALPRNVPQFHKDALTHNNFALDVDCYPDNYTPEKYIPSKDVTEEAIEDQQISLFDLSL